MLVEFRIKKIKLDNSGRSPKILIRYERPLPSDPDDYDEFALRSSDKPRDQFYVALAALIPYVLEICEVANTWDEDTVKVTGVSFSYKDDVFGAVVTAQKKLKLANSPLIINTPSRTNAPYSENGDEDLCFDNKTAKLLENLQDEALRYINGDRKQSQLSLLDQGDSPAWLAELPQEEVQESLL